MHLFPTLNGHKIESSAVPPSSFRTNSYLLKPCKFPHLPLIWLQRNFVLFNLLRALFPREAIWAEKIRYLRYRKARKSKRRREPNFPSECEAAPSRWDDRNLIKNHYEDFRSARVYPKTTRKRLNFLPRDFWLKFTVSSQESAGTRPGPSHLGSKGECYLDGRGEPSRERSIFNFRLEVSANIGTATRT